MRKQILLAAAALTCPCHLPLLAVLLAGTALGGFLSDNLLLIFPVFALIFAGSLWAWSRQAGTMPAGAMPERPAAMESGTAVGQAEPLRLQILQTPGCASCTAVERSWEALRPEYGDRIQVQTADLLEQPELARRYGVLVSPAVVIDGRLRAQGALNPSQLRRLLDEALRERRAVAGVGEGAHA